MQISSRFTIAVHIFTCIAIAEKKYKVTSKFLAGSINVNPVIIRNIVLMLKAHGLIDSRQGTSGIKIAKCPSDITLLDIFNAVESLDNGQLFSFMKPGSGLSGRQSHSLCAGWPFGADSECP